MLVNPGRKEWSAAAGLLYTGVQIMNPGEFTSAHRHQASALRFVMEGKGAYTVVDGERLELGARDFVLTPNGTWHDHGVEPRRHAMHLAGRPRHPADEFAGCEFLRSASADRADARAAVARELEEALLAGVFVQMGFMFFRTLRKKRSFEYKNPLTGGSVMPTMGARLELIKSEHKFKSHTGSVIYQVASGHGWSEIGDQRFEWEEKDIFCIPSWTPLPARRGRRGGALFLQRFPGDEGAGPVPGIA